MPPRVDVLVDLEYGPASGGHVKCWERIAEAATRLGDDGLDLTIHFSGAQARRLVLSERVRYLTHRPVFSTARLPFLSHIPDHTDLAPFHPGLARALVGSEVIHTTDAYFAFARAARVVARAYRVPLVNSVHTDTPRYARLFTRATVRRLCGEGWLGRFLLDGLRVDQGAERDMTRRLERYQDASAVSLVSRIEDLEPLAARVGRKRAGLLRRGIDCRLFTPTLRDRGWLAAQFGVPADRVLILCVGRVNAGKSVMTLATAVRALAERGAPVHLFCAGNGDQRDEVKALLGTRATCPGALTTGTLAQLYACADIFALPSRIEIHANVVMEALASGVPALVSMAGGMGRVLREGETGMVIADDGPEPWIRALDALVRDGGRRAAMAAAARESAVRDLPSWDDVLRQDLLPVWRRVAGLGP